MGGKQSKPQNQGSKIFSNMMTHKNFAFAQIIQPHNSDPTYVEMNYAVGNKQMYSKWKENVEFLLKSNDNADTLYLPKSLQFQQKGMCGRSGSVKARYDFLPFILHDQIINRKVISQHFNEQQVLYMIYILTCAGLGLHSKNKIIGDVRPANIFISQDGQIRICTLHTFLEQQTNYRKFLTAKQPTFIAPQQIQELQNGKIDSSVNLAKAECFSIGLTLLSVILLIDQSQLYKPRQISFDQSQFNHQLTTLRQAKQYHIVILSIIYGLCQYDPKNRLSCQQIVQLLKPYQNSILQLSQFQFNEEELPSNFREQLIKKSLLGSQVRGSYTKVVNLNEHSTQKTIVHNLTNIQVIDKQQQQLPNTPNIQPIHSPLSYHQHHQPPPVFKAQRFTNDQSSGQVRQNQLTDGHGLQNNNSNVTFMNMNVNNGDRRMAPLVSSSPTSSYFAGSSNIYDSGSLLPSSKYTPNQNRVRKQIANYNDSKDSNNDSFNYNVQYRSYQQTTNKIQKPSDISLFEYGSKIDSYIPPQPLHTLTSINANAHSIHLATDTHIVSGVAYPNNPIPVNTQKYVPQIKSTLASMGRETTSIRPLKNHQTSDDNSYSYNNPYGDNYGHQNNTHSFGNKFGSTQFSSSYSRPVRQYRNEDSDNLFQSYKDIMSSVDKQLEQSRRNFPQQ